MSNLSLNEVTYRYKNSSKDAISGISCEFCEGKVNAIVGPSGSGKTTLLSIVAGFDQSYSGTIRIDTESLSDLNLDQYRRQRISMIFQAYHLFPLLKVQENVCYPQELNGVKSKDAKKRAEELLETVGISKEKHKRFPANLSGGEQQRVAIARALSTGSKVILADEPTGNLDTENSQRVMELLRYLAHEQGYCVVIVTHDMEIAAASDVVYKMSDGVIV